MSVRALRRGSIAASRVTAPATSNVLTLPGTSGNYVSTPDTVAASITSDIDIRAHVTLTDWSAAGEQWLLAKIGPSGADRSYGLGALNGLLRLRIYENGTSSIIATSTVGHGFTNGTDHWVRATWNNTTNVTQFFTSADGSSWTQLGTDVSHSATGIFDSATAVTIGANSAGATNLMTGNVYYTEVRNGIGGTIVLSFDATAVTKLGTRNPTTVPAGGTAGGNWTVNGSAWDWASV